MAGDEDRGDSEPDVSTPAGDGPTDADAAERDVEAVVEELDAPVILFDGVCNLCNGFVRFVVRFDAAGTFRFAPLQSPVGRALLDRHDVDAAVVASNGAGSDDTAAVDADGALDSMVLVEADRVTTKSTAALRIFRRLDGPWPLLWPLVSLPERPRNSAYDLVARNRYRVFGRKEECPIPEPEVRERFAERSLE